MEGMKSVAGVGRILTKAAVSVLAMRASNTEMACAACVRIEYGAQSRTRCRTLLG